MSDDRIDLLPPVFGARARLRMLNRRIVFSVLLVGTVLAALSFHARIRRSGAESGLIEARDRANEVLAAELREEFNVFRELLLKAVLAVVEGTFMERHSNVRRSVTRHLFHGNHDHVHLRDLRAAHEVVLVEVLLPLFKVVKDGADPLAFRRCMDLRVHVNFPGGGLRLEWCNNATPHVQSIELLRLFELRPATSRQPEVEIQECPQVRACPDGVETGVLHEVLGRGQLADIRHLDRSALLPLGPYEQVLHLPMSADHIVTKCIYPCLLVRLAVLVYKVLCNLFLEHKLAP